MEGNHQGVLILTLSVNIIVNITCCICTNCTLIIIIIIRLLSNHSVYNADNYLDTGNICKIVEELK